MRTATGNAAAAITIITMNAVVAMIIMENITMNAVVAMIIMENITMNAVVAMTTMSITMNMPCILPHMRAGM